VKAGKFHKEKTLTKEVTRYNEVTGEPYKKQTSTVVHTFGTKEFSEEEWKDFLCDVGDEPDDKLGCVVVGCEDKFDESVLGRKVFSTDSNRMSRRQIVEVDLVELNKQLVEVRVELAKFGIPAEEVKVFLMPHYSY
jgi:hypothetical protein